MFLLFQVCIYAEQNQALDDEGNTCHRPYLQNAQNQHVGCTYGAVVKTTVLPPYVAQRVVDSTRTILCVNLIELF